VGELYYCLIYTGVVQEQATACVAIMINIGTPHFLETKTGWQKWDEGYVIFCIHEKVR
jgi:hypothetical protein